MRHFCGLALAAVALVVGVGCTKTLPEHEIYGKWERERATVDFTLKSSSLLLKKIGNQVKAVVEPVLGESLQSMKCGANNELAVRVVNTLGGSRESSEVHGAYFYRPDEQLKMAITGDANERERLSALFYGGVVGTQFTPQLRGDKLELTMSEGVAELLVRLVLSDEMLPVLLSKFKGEEVAADDPLVIAVKLFMTSVESVSVRVTLRRAD